jgi:DNA-binding MarR family transcriptional regulator
VRNPGFLIWHVSIKWRVAVDRALSPFGLTHVHYLLLGSLYEFCRSGAKPSQRELAEFAGLEVVYVSKLVRVLERSGKLRRADHPDDPRAFQLELTASGAGLVGHAWEVTQELYDQLLKPIGGGTSKRSMELMETLEMLFDEAEMLNRIKPAHPRQASGQSTQPLRKSATRKLGTRKSRSQ